MYAANDRSLVLPISGAVADPAAAAAARNCQTRGAHLISIEGNHPDARLAAISSFPAAVALAAQLGLGRDIDVDQPPWLEAYYAAARTRTSNREPTSPTQPPEIADRS